MVTKAQVEAQRDALLTRLQEAGLQGLLSVENDASRVDYLDSDDDDLGQCVRSFMLSNPVLFFGVTDDDDVVPVTVDDDGVWVDDDGVPLVPPPPEGLSAGAHRPVPSVAGAARRTHADPKALSRALRRPGPGAVLAPKPVQRRQLTDVQFAVTPQLEVEVYTKDANGDPVMANDEFTANDLRDPSNVLSAWGRTLVTTPVLTFGGKPAPTYYLRVRVTLVVETLDTAEAVTTPEIELPRLPLPLPEFLLFCTETNFQPMEPEDPLNPFGPDGDGAAYVINQPKGTSTSGLKKEIVDAFDKVVGVITNLPGELPAAGPVSLGVIGNALDVFSKIPTAITTVGDQDDFDDWTIPGFTGSNLNDESGSLLLVAEPGRVVSLFSAKQWKSDEGAFDLKAGPLGFTFVHTLRQGQPETLPPSMLDVTHPDDDANGFDDSLSSMKWH